MIGAVDLLLRWCCIFCPDYLYLDSRLVYRWLLTFTVLGDETCELFSVMPLEEAERIDKTLHKSLAVCRPAVVDQAIILATLLTRLVEV